MHVNVYIYIKVCSGYASTPLVMKYNTINGNQTKEFKTAKLLQTYTNQFYWQLIINGYQIYRCIVNHQYISY